MDQSLDYMLWNFLQPKLPRILSQLSRDPDSPTFGSWDRNFWHYKMRDFSSMILQQGMIVADSLERFKGPDNPFYQHPRVKEWVDGSLEFWADGQLKNGSFNEYYPFESGYPPTAFSLYAVGLVLKNRGYSDPGTGITRAIQKAVDWLLKNQESEALNQEAAGLAGIVLCSSLPGVQVDQRKLEKRLKDLYNSQSQEGWFPEYDGPDTGYLSVTIDCLWEIYEATNDLRAYSAMESAIAYIAGMISVSAETPVMINSRNTDYLVIYGMTRMALEGNTVAGTIVTSILKNLSSPTHFLNRTDDRYSVHYVYSSYFRSLNFLRDFENTEQTGPAFPSESKFYLQAGIFVVHKLNEYSIYLNLKKGGIVSIYSPSGIGATDYGWRQRIGRRKVAVTHWLHPSYITEMNGEMTGFTVSGKMSVHSWMVPGPLKHVILRMTSFLLGNRLIPLLKKVMIFNEKEAGINFVRRIKLTDDQLIINDTFTSSSGDLELYRAPHYSLRHVSSAGQFVPEELLPIGENKPEKAGRELMYSRIINLR